MKSFFIGRSDEENTNPVYAAFQQACNERGREYVLLDSQEVDLTALPTIDPSDTLYRIATRQHDAILEHVLTTQNTIRGTIYSDGTIHRKKRQYIHHAEAKIPIPTTIEYVAKGKSEEVLHHYVEALGGFPIIVKATGGSHGVGVMKVDSFAALTSLIDVLHANDIHFILREFVHVRTSARLIVLGDRVVDSIEYHVQGDDFRSNVGEEPAVIRKQFSPEVETIAVRATQLGNTEFAGVDVLITDDGMLYVAEVNTPCYFIRAQQATGVDIAGLLLDYLIQKTQ